MPFISVFIWLKNVKTPCITFPVYDWGEIETDLEKRT